MLLQKLKYLVPVILLMTYSASPGSQDFRVEDLRKLRNIPKYEISKSKIQDDWYIGFDDPNEIVTINGARHVPGNIVIANNGALILQGADFSIAGDITLMGQASLEIKGGTFVVVQDYAYQYEIIVLDSASLSFRDMTFSSGGHGWSVTLTGTSEYTMHRSEVRDGFITMALAEQAGADIRDSQMPGEFLSFGENNLYFSGCDFVLIWLVLPENSHMDISLPGDSLLASWQLSDSLENISGIDYSVRIDSCTDVQWGLISNPNSSATFSDSDIRVAGMMFTEPDSVVIENVTNNSHFTDHDVSVSDRELRFVNTSIMTWNFYPTGNSILTVQNSVFGEMLSMGNARAYVINSVCDGSGGYIGAVENAFLIAFRSLLSCQVISRGQAVLAGIHSAFTGQEIDADDNGVMALINTPTYVEPQAHNGGFIFEENLPPVEGMVNSSVPVIGTARIIKGPQNPADFDHYSMSYSQQDDAAWHRMNGANFSPVTNDTLAIWNTAGLDPGNYQLRLTLFHTYGDSLSTESTARLALNTHIRLHSDTEPGAWQLFQNYPNPFNPVTMIRYHIPQEAFVRLRLFDILGREIGVLVNGQQSAGTHDFEFDGSRLSSGIYYYRLDSGSFSEIRPMMLVK